MLTKHILGKPLAHTARQPCVKTHTAAEANMSLIPAFCLPKMEMPVSEQRDIDT